MRSLRLDRIQPSPILSRLLFKKRRSVSLQDENSGLGSFKAPLEVLILILRGLDYKSLLRCAATCRSLRSVVNTAFELQYIIALAAEGIEDDSNAPNTGERLQILLDRRERWRALDWKPHHHHLQPLPASRDIMQDPTRFIDFTNSVFVKNTVIAPIHINDFSLPEDAPLDNYAPLLVHNFNSDPVVQTYIDPDLDLLVLLKTHNPAPDLFSYDLHLRSLQSAGRRVHPRCSFAILHETLPTPPWPRPLISVSGDFIALSVCHVHVKHLRVWNWVTGRMIAQAFDNDCTSELYDLTFISPDVLIAAVSKKRFEPKTRDRSAMIWVYDLTVSCPGNETAEYGEFVPEIRPLVLQLPGFRDKDISVLSFTCMTDSPAGYSPPDGSGRSLRRLPYAITLNLFTGNLESSVDVDLRSTVMIVRSDAFRSLLNVYAPPWITHKESLPWKKWGPTHTRLFRPTDFHAMVHSPVGRISNGRLVIPADPVSYEKPLSLIDFHIGRHKPDELVSKPSTIRSSPFKSSVTTSLPYHLTLIHNPHIRQGGEFILGDDYLMTCHPIERDSNAWMDPPADQGHPSDDVKEIERALRWETGRSKSAKIEHGVFPQEKVQRVFDCS
ncbi:hypothetical protein EVG20_g8507 [Dentipellis fragilis]|uniref:F-box domain-containing protein n=1 Tax=Dentipellis fragilis TaxID=205917 RepID=A0A4Y9Y517_9AGAM|nr:hypothetical protein EVG20_g8507 [Dentipellis fragilis]